MIKVLIVTCAFCMIVMCPLSSMDSFSHISSGVCDQVSRPLCVNKHEVCDHTWRDLALTQMAGQDRQCRQASARHVSPEADV